MAKVEAALPASGQKQPWITGKPWYVKAIVYGLFIGWIAGIVVALGEILIYLYR
jgi:hypothetical protein